MLRHVLPRPAVLGGLSRSGLPWEAGYLEHFSLASDPESAASRKQVLLEEGWPCGEMPSKSELRERMLACAALRYKVGLVYHGNAAETGEYLYDPNYTRRGTSNKWSIRCAQCSNRPLSSLSSGRGCKVVKDLPWVCLSHPHCRRMRGSCFLSPYL